ncbi:MAG: DUF366 family protein [Planctomycetota bacterium]|jgi:hypothetical protein
MRSHFADASETYDGSQLRGGWIGERFGLEPDCVVAWVGPCDVASEHMIDLEDLEAGDVIRAREMVHFIAEHSDGDLARAALRQRLLVACAREALEEGWHLSGFARDGDDLYVTHPGERRKLTVSIATRSGGAGTGLIHLGVNVDPEGAPVPAAGLGELRVEPARFAGEVMVRYARETASAAHAVGKVREAP